MSDINLIIKDRDGEVHKVIAPTDIAMNIMEVIRSYELVPEGTIGVCGGIAMCASCQCYINSKHPLPDMEEDEEAMLSEAFYVKENSRLACQIAITKELDNLSFEIAQKNHHK